MGNTLNAPVLVAAANTGSRVMNMIEIPVNSIASISFSKATEALLITRSCTKLIGKSFPIKVECLPKLL